MVKQRHFQTNKGWEDSCCAVTKSKGGSSDVREMVTWKTQDGQKGTVITGVNTEGNKKQHSFKFL